MSVVGQSRHFGRRPLLPVLPWKRTSSGPVAMSQRCQKRTSHYDKSLRRQGRAMAAMTGLATVDQLLRTALVVLDASGNPGGFQ
jgi:hypothetical protein